MNFEKFGNAYIEIESICAVTFAYESDMTFDAVGKLVKPTESDKLREVAVFFKSGAILQMTGKEAEEFEQYWKYVTEPRGDIA